MLGITLQGEEVEIIDIQPYTERNDKYWILEIRLKDGSTKRLIYDITEYKRWVRINSRL
jgi:hypothetical protein